MDAGDFTLRFYNYVCSLSKGIAGAMPLGVNILPSSHSITYLCLPDTVFDKRTALRTQALRGPSSMELPPKYAKMQPRRVMMPQAWTAADVEQIRGLYADKTVKFIVFPLVCKKKVYVCKDVNNDIKKHTVLLAYNKAACHLEYWDDMFGTTQRVFGSFRLLRTDLLKDYFISVLHDGFGFKFKEMRLQVPKFNENLYARIKRALATANLENNYTAIYAAFLIDYIKRRMRAPVKTEYNAIAFDKLASQYDALQRWNFAWKQEHRCESPSKVLNPETGNCINARSERGRDILGMHSDACPFPQLRNVSTNACKKIDIQQHFIEDTSTSFLKEHVAWNNPSWDKLMQYFLHKFPYAATAADNEFVWKIHTGSSWKLTPPKTFHLTMKKGLSNPNVRFIVFFIDLTQDDFAFHHSNVILIDKHAKTLERFEPSTPEGWPEFNNDKPLDDAIAKAFKAYGLQVLPMMATCPIGFQGFEVAEDSAGFVDFGGNCQLWTVWYMHLRLSNPHIPRDVLVKGTWKALMEEGSLKTFINGYHHFLTKTIRGP